MKPIFSKRLRILGSSDWYRSLRGIKRGIEKESLRINLKGELAQTPHPIGLGSSLTHPMITTDYSEALLEFITPPSEDLEVPFQQLSDLHQYTHSILQEEALWPGSMPCLLPNEKEIPIANYGISNLGQLKTIYRRGLGYRYGRMMQTISGVHYNFSLPMQFWTEYRGLLKSTLPLSLFISEQYLSLIRNCLRYSGLLTLLFGASPAADLSFFKKSRPILKPWGSQTLIGPYSTSLRLSDLGYHNSAQSRALISYNGSLEFLSSIRNAVHTRHPAYRDIGIKVAGEYRQMSDCIFQTEDEFYGLIRPKRVSGPEERMLSAMLKWGVEYIEVRAIDVDPFSPIGIDPQMTRVLDAFLIFCLLKESPPMTVREQDFIEQNLTMVIGSGRTPSLSFLSSALSLLEDLEGVASLLNQTYDNVLFTEAVKVARERLLQPESLPSARVLQEMETHRESYCEFGSRWALKHQAYFKDQKLPSALNSFYNQMAIASTEAQKVLEQGSTESLDTYLQRFLQA